MKIDELTRLSALTKTDPEAVRAYLRENLELGDLLLMVLLGIVMWAARGCVLGLAVWALLNALGCTLDMWAVVAACAVCRVVAGFML